MRATPSHEEEVSVIQILQAGETLQCLFLRVEQDAPCDFALGAGAWEFVFTGHPSQQAKASVRMVPCEGSVAVNEEDKRYALKREMFIT